MLNRDSVLPRTQVETSFGKNELFFSSRFCILPNNYSSNKSKSGSSLAFFSEVKRYRRVEKSNGSEKIFSNSLKCY